MVRLLEMLEAGKIVTAAASKDVLDILGRQQVRDGIARHAAEDLRVASKSGALDALRSDVGIVYSKGGPIALAITVDDMPVTDYSPDNARQHAHLAARVSAHGRVGRSLTGTSLAQQSVEPLTSRALRTTFRGSDKPAARRCPDGIPPKVHVS